MNIAVLNVECYQTCFGSAASASIELAYIHYALKENFSVPLTNKGFTLFFTDLSRTTCALGRTVNTKYCKTRQLRSRGTQREFWENICSEDDLRSRIFGTFCVKFLACLPLLAFSNI